MFCRMSKTSGKRSRTDEADSVVVLRVESMEIENWERKLFSRGKGDEKVRYDVQYMSTPERPTGVPLWKVGWYKELYEKCVSRFLVEEGCPRAILTDNGREFDNKLLRELMRLCRIRLRFTPPYHPRGNYTERVNRSIGESLRAMVNSPSGCKQDWHKLVTFVCNLLTAGRRMFIPGANLTL